MSNLRHRLPESPIRQNVLVAGYCGAHSHEASEGADRRNQCVLKHMGVATFLGDVKPDAISAQSFVGSNFAYRVFDRVSKIFERLSCYDSHDFPRIAQMLLFASTRRVFALIRIVHPSRTGHKAKVASRCFYCDVQPQVPSRNRP